jgi:hypothetical protein
MPANRETTARPLQHDGPSVPGSGAVKVTDPDELWRLQYVQQAGWSRAGAVAANRLLGQFLERKEKEHSVASAAVKATLARVAVSSWVADRGFVLNPPRHAVRSAKWCWQLIRSWVLRRDFVTTYMAPSVQDAGNASALKRRHSYLRGARATAQNIRRVAPQPEPLPVTASMEEQYRALVMYRDALRRYLTEESASREAAHQAAVDSHTSLVRRSSDSTRPQATSPTHPGISGFMSLSQPTSPLTMGRGVSSASPTHKSSTMMMSSFETAVTGSVASGVSGRLSASKLNSNALLLHIRRQAQIDAETAMNEQGGALQTSDDELQRAIARREVELLVELVDVMNEQTHVDDEERVDLPPSQKLARRLWFGRRVRDGVYLHEDHRQQVSTFDRARANDAVTHGAVYVSPVRNRNVAVNDTDNDSDRSPRSPGRDTSIRVVTTTDVAGATRTRAIPSTVSRRGVLMCSPIPTAKQSQQRQQSLGSPAASPTAGSAKRPGSSSPATMLLGEDKPKVRGNMSSRLLASVGRDRRLATTPASCLLPPRPSSSLGTMNASRARTPSMDLFDREEKLKPLPTQIAVTPAIPVVDFSRCRLRYMAEILKVTPKLVNFKPVEETGGDGQGVAHLVTLNQLRSPAHGRKNSFLRRDTAALAVANRQAIANARVYDFGAARNATAALHMQAKTEDPNSRTDGGWSMAPLPWEVESNAGSTGSAKQQQLQRQRKMTASFGMSMSRRSSYLSMSASATTFRDDGPPAPAGPPLTKKQKERIHDVTEIVRRLKEPEKRLLDDGALGDLVALFCRQQPEVPLPSGPDTSQPHNVPYRSTTTVALGEVHPPSALPCGMLLLNNNQLTNTREIPANVTAAAAAWANQATTVSAFEPFAAVLSLRFGSNCWMSNIVLLDLSENHLVAAPQEITQLLGLQTLKLHGNRIATMSSVEALARSNDFGAQLTSVTLYGNPVVDVMGRAPYADALCRLFPRCHMRDGVLVVPDA